MLVISISCPAEAQAGSGQFHISINRNLTPCLLNPENGAAMHHNNDPPDNPTDANYRRFRSLEPDEELLELEAELRERHLLYDPTVQWLMQKAPLVSDKNRQWAIQQIRMVLKAESIEDMRTGDVFRPLAPEQLLSNGNLHLYNQVDGIPWRIPLDALTLGAILTGRQGGGKTYFLLSILTQLNAFNPPIPFFILDPKQGLKEWAHYLDATYIDIEDVSIDLAPPPGLTYEQFLPSLMPQIGDIVGLIYGTEILQEAAQICIDLRNQYLQRTGKNTEISLYDLLLAVPFVKDSGKGRRLGYREAVTTSIGRILTGSGNLFKCRKGIDLATLFNKNVILGCRSITDDFAAKFLTLHLLYWLYESERSARPTDHLKRLLVLDDAAQNLSIKQGFDTACSTSSFTNIYARLRSSGNGVIATTQIPHLADPGILALSHTVICVGGLHYGKDIRLLAEMMGLGELQRQGLRELNKREAVGICAGSAFPGAVHGYTVDVTDPKGGC